jgi:hypothetical protein
MGHATAAALFSGLALAVRAILYSVEDVEQSHFFLLAVPELSLFSGMHLCHSIFRLVEAVRPYRALRSGADDQFHERSPGVAHLGPP